MSHIGGPAIRSDAWSKVNGETVYAYDYKEAGMLYGVLVRSPYAAGKLLRCDLGKARAMAGVRAAIAAADVPAVLAGWSMRDTPLFAREGVRYIGEPIAAVAADSLAEARRLIGVDYRGAQATIEVTADNIRSFCNYMGSENPLFLDPEYAAQTRWGASSRPRRWWARRSSPRA